MSVFLSPFPSDSPLPIVPLSLSRVHPVLVHPSLSRAAYRASLSLPDTDQRPNNAGPQELLLHLRIDQRHDGPAPLTL